MQTLEDVGRAISWRNSPNYGALKITKSQFYRPNGDSTQNRGVLADVTLPSVANHGDLGEANAEFAVPFDRVPPAAYRKEDWVDPALIAKIDEHSRARRATSDDWAEVDRKIAQYLKYKDRKRVSLERGRFIAEWNDMQSEGAGKLTVKVDPEKSGMSGWTFARPSAESTSPPDVTGKEDEEPKEDSKDVEESKILRDFYLDEALAVTIDFIRLRPASKLPN